MITDRQTDTHTHTHTHGTTTITLAAHARRGLIRPSIDYGSEVWESNKGQTNALECVALGGAKKSLGCSSKTCNEAVRGDT